MGNSNFGIKTAMAFKDTNFFGVCNERTYD